MASGSQNMTTYNARTVTGSNSAASPAGALLLSGVGRADDATGDTWIFLDSREGASTPWGIKHDQANNQIQIFGAGANSVWTQMNTGNTYIGGSLNTGSTLTVRAQNNTREGGEIILSPATSSFSTAHIDAYDSLFRLHDGTNERFKVNISNGNTTIYGNLGIGTDYAGSGGSYKLYVNGTSFFNGHMYLAAAKHIYMSYNSTNYNVLHNHNNGNVSLNAASAGLYMAYQNTTFVNWMDGRMELRDGCLSLFPNNSSYREGIRIHTTGSWSDITLCGNDNTGNSGTSANSWFIGNNNGNFYITRYGSNSSGADAQRSEFSSVNNQWRLRSYVQAHKTGIYRSGLHIYGPTYGNTAADMASGTAGLFSWNDGGPQITFDTNATPGGGQAGALIFTDNDTAGAGASWHFVSNQSDWNVTSKRFHARTSISIGTNLPNTSYNLYVNGSTYFNGNTTHNGIDYFANGTTYYINNSAVAYLNDLRSDNVRLVDNWIGFYENANAGGNRYGYIQANANRMYFRKENGVSTYHFDFNGHIYTSTNIYAPTGSIWAGTNDDTAAERQVGVQSGAGKMYMYAAASATGSRGIYVSAHGSGSERSVFVVGTNNEISFADYYNGTATKLAYSQSGLAASDISWLTCWNGYELRAISKAQVFNAVRDNGGDTRWVNVSGDTMTGQLYINYDQDVNLGQNGSLIIGTKSGSNVALDANEIMARSNGAASTLYINNEGGLVQIGSGGVTSAGTITSSAGYLKSTHSSNTVTIGSQNTGFCHFMNSANIPFYFNKTVQVDGSIYVYNSTHHLDSTAIYAYRWRTTNLELAELDANRMGLCNHGQGTAKGLNVGSLLVSSAWADASKVPTNGIYSKGGAVFQTNITNLTGYIKGEGDSYTNHAIKLGHNGDDVCIFYEYGSLWRFYTSSSGSNTQRAYIDSQGVHSAVWNDFAEYRAATTEEPGRVVISHQSGQMQLASQRLQPSGHVISDTFGCSVGESDKAKSPIAVAGRVLVYPYQNRNNYNIGDAVCTAPNGTVDIMTREEIIKYPDRIIGIVDEIPNYDVWQEKLTLDDANGEYKPIQVKGRIWIYVR